MVEIKKKAEMNRDQQSTRRPGVWIPQTLGGSKNRVFGIDYVYLLECLKIQELLPDFFGQYDKGNRKESRNCWYF